MKVIIPDVLQSYTGAREVMASGDSVAAVFDSLDEQFPGIRFRVINELCELRPHIKVFINGEKITSLSVKLEPDDEVFIMQALSGG